MKLFDVTRSIHPGMRVYSGDPSVVVRQVSSIAAGASVNVSLLRFGSHTGTHVDPPRHFFDGGPGVDELPLEVLIGPVLLHELSAREQIDGAGLKGLDLTACPRVLFKVRPPAGPQDVAMCLQPPGLTGEAAEALVEAGIRLVGLESLSADSMASVDFPAHRRLLGAGVIILEGLDLSAVPSGSYELWCLPLKLRGGDGAPTRVVLRTLD